MKGFGLLMNGISGKLKLQIVAEVVLIVLVLVFHRNLRQFNQILFNMRSRYDNEILWAFSAFHVERFLSFFFGGILAAIALGVLTIIFWKTREDQEETIFSLIAGLINIILVILLIVALNNPIFRIILIVISIGGGAGVFAIAKN